ncbi:MAG: hypothetical protein AABY88_11105 [Pseudomonadota bacterium]
MTVSAARRARLLHLRTIEHRVAKAKLARADATLINLERVIGRIEEIRSSLGAGEGGTSGMALKAMSEMSSRLESARNGMATPLSEAIARRAEFDALRNTARIKEEGATKLYERAMMTDAVSRDLRADANRPHRKRNQYLETSE